MAERDPSLAPFHPVLAEWFHTAFGSPTDAQRRCWEAILSGSHTLLAAPTGSGKTLAALLPCLDRVLRMKETSTAAQTSVSGVRVLYVTPLKALNNDIYEHVTDFVEEIGRLYHSSLPSSGNADEQDSEPANKLTKKPKAIPGITCAVRTGDTSASARAAMLRRPPDVLVTTPESLFIMLGSAKSRAMLQSAEQIIVDEIHDLAGDKRGSHLSLTMERLEAWCGRPLQRIGLSATQKPMDRVARFLGGWAHGAAAAKDAPSTGLTAEQDSGKAAAHVKQASELDAVQLANQGASLQAAEPLPPHPLGYSPRPVVIIESAMKKSMQVSVTMPDHSRLHRSRESVWFPIMDRLLQLMEDCRSVLVFVNSRRLAERLCLRLNDYTGYEMCRSHHGSMDRGRRLEVERLLKEGQLRCIVATSSLELGIDVGHVDLVIQLDSPLSAAAGIQRIGRAGHSVGDVSRGVILARQRGSLPEIAVLSRMIAQRDIEPIEVPRDALDVLSQQTVAMAADGDWTLEELYQLIAGSDSYRAFPRPRLESMLAVLAGFYPFARPLLEWDREANRIGARSNSRMAAITGAGTIPQSSAYPVHHIDSRSHIGELDEEFVHESRVGDVFQLGTNSWMIQQINRDRIYVTEASNSLSEIPFWKNESGSRSYLLGERVAALWTDLMDRLQKAEPGPDGQAILNGGAADLASSLDSGEGGTYAHLQLDNRTELGDDSKLLTGTEADGADALSVDGDMPFSAAQEEVILQLREEFSLDDRAARSMTSLAKAQMATGVIPTASRLAVEIYKDISGQTHIVIHNAWGRRVNRTWQLAIERRFEAGLPYRLYGNAKDNGIEFVLPDWDPSWLQAVQGVTSDTLPSLLMEALPGSPLLAVAFRRIAETSLLLTRSFTRMPMWQMRLRGEELLRAALPYADRFPYLEEAMRECLNVYLDMPRLAGLLDRMKAGEISLSLHYRDRPSPLASQFAADYVNMRIYEGEGLDRAVQAQLLQMSRELAGELFGQEALAGAIDPGILASERKRLEDADGLSLRNADELYRLLKQRGDSTEQELLRLVALHLKKIAADAGEDGEMEEPPASTTLLLHVERNTDGTDFGAAEARSMDDLAVAGQAAAWLKELLERRKISLYEPGQGLPSRFICCDEAETYKRFPADPDAETYVAERYMSTRIAFTPEELAERYPVLRLAEAERLTARLLEADRIQRAPFAEPGERLYSSSLTAARIVRLSVQAARGRSEAVDAVRWCSLIAGRQHALQGTQLRGEHGLLQVLEQLQGFFFPLSHWESFILPSRLAAYRPEELDLLCASGEVLWLGRRDDGGKEGKIAFFLPDAKDLYEPCLPQEESSSHPELLQLLKHGGAMFLTRMARELGRQPSEVQAQLIELVWEGHVSNDQFAPLRSSGTSKSSKPKSGRAAAWSGSGLGRWFWTGSLMHNEPPPPRSSLGKQQDSLRLTDEMRADSRLTNEMRADSLRLSHEMQADSESSPAVRWINRLLDTYGIVSRDLAASASPYSWDELLPLLKRLEEWGVLVRGHLIEGMPAMQFTTREIAEAIRSPLLESENSGLTVLSAADPANPFGLIADWPGSETGGFSRKPGNYLVLENGRWLYWIENNGRRISRLEQLGTDTPKRRGQPPKSGAAAPSSGLKETSSAVRQMLAAVAARQGLAKVTVEQWNGKPVDESEGAELLKELGAERDRHRFVLWKSQLTRI
ncbi:DEAD/DEAH box helicase [Paenibacillus pasadenensis]|uniref:DEAD/DEAH box helicase n=1 Tax=Paenibacillus pasadenensis TaxID=217090 RepID=UPI00203BD7FE|nr:DEAD/DEAH box helicase [Paenibacillus pasadenensis]MCM3747691.1 DEAD/DEAH box helicase [Paenibacillus pasadenensis]